MKKKIILTITACTAAFCILTGCGSSSTSDGSAADSTATAGSSSKDSAAENQTDGSAAENRKDGSADGSTAGSQTGETTDGSTTGKADESADESTDKSTAGTTGTLEMATSADDIDISYYADINVKDYGTITVALSEEAAPETVKNFVSLAESGFYDGLTFHRIIDGFMIQGGDPNGDGTGGSDQTIPGEFSKNGFTGNNISHVRGAISMARSNDYDSASSQFFIVQSDSTYLDGEYAGFGFVTDGMDVVDQICTDVKPTDNNGTVSKDQQPVITSITIRNA